jgi:1-acyl-sn-glycerol-3-phosphate acyltransferase
MLTLERLRKVRLHTRSLGQKMVANLGLVWDYRLPRRTRIDLEGVENLPDEPVIFAMNHTDRYNYWPFQYATYRRGLPMTVTWVKGKYYENALMGWFMDHCNNIPVPSKGYLITVQMRQATGTVPDGDSYRALRTLMDTGALPDSVPDDVRSFLDSQGGPDAWRAEVDALFAQMMVEVVKLNRQALDIGCNLIIFPQGTRSIRLSKGRIGLAQLAQHLGATIVPVGCNGSDGVYPGGSPFAKGGHIVYRIGKPLPVDHPELAPHRIQTPFQPFTAEADAHRPAFEAITQVVMDRINDLLDPQYQYADDAASDGVQGAKRFV